MINVEILLMKKQLLLGLMFGLGMSQISTVWAAVKIIAPEDIRVMAINDQEIKSGFLKAKNSEYTINAGQNNLYVRYEQIYDDERADMHDVVKSEVLQITTPELKDGEQYTLAIPNKPTSLEAARTFAKNPTIALYNQQGQKVAEQTGANSGRPFFSGGLFSRGYDLTKEKVKQALPQKTEYQAPVVTTAESVNTSTAQPTAISQQMIELWKKAPAADREKFLIWLNQQAK